MLEKEFDYYLKNQNELLKKYNNRTVVIVGEKVVGDYESRREAIVKTAQNYEPGTFLVQKCSEGDKDYTMRFHSRVRFG